MLNAPLDNLYFGGDIEILRRFAGEFPPEFVLSDGNKTQKLIAEIIASNDDISQTLFNSYSKSLQKAVENVFGKTGYGDKNFEIGQQFIANVSRFAAYKAYHVTEAVRRQQTDQDGVGRSDEEFYRYARQVLNTANRYQAAEYQAAISRSRTAKQWQEFQDDPDVPNLKWIPSRAAHPREAHKRYYGLVLPKTHPFWQTNQPGNVWGCKCDWIETFDDAADKAPAGPPPAQGLEGNPAQTGEIFTDRASYFKSVNKKTGKQINNIYAIFSRKTAVEDGKTLYGKKTKVNTDSGEIDVEYNRDGIEHIAYDRLSGNRNYIKNQIIKYLDKYLENAEFIKSAENHKLDKKPNVERYYYYKIILPDGKPAYLNVQKKKGKYTLYAMTETLKEN